MIITKGTILDGTYKVIEQIGAGGGGIVYKARHLRLQTDVVIKKIKDEVREKVKLRQEVDILKNLKHPYLPRVFDFIEIEDGVYTIMDFISGEDMDSAIKRRGKFSQKEVMKWAEQLGDVLAYLHGQNPPIIHSDIKPANIMLTESGDICLIDFNISLAAGADAESAVGVSVGFSPPEQYKDPALYARVTKNYTLQKLSEAVFKDVNSKSLPVDDNKTVLLNASFEERTQLLQNMSDDEKTVLLNSISDDERTVLLSSLPNDDKTVLMSSVPQYQESAVIPKVKTSLPSQGMITGNSGKLPPYTMYMGRGIDSRSDIYSLGITLYYLLTGIEPPVDFEKRVPISDTNVKISEGFAIILEKMMALEPDERYQNGKAFYDAICNCYKLDKRYISMHRTQRSLQLAALGCLVLGILLVFSGVYKMKMDKENLYYSYIQEAKMFIESYEFEPALAAIAEAKTISDIDVAAYEEEVYLYYISGNYDECINVGESFINASPFILESNSDKELFGNIIYMVGNSYFENKDYANAKNYLEYAFEYNAQNGMYYRDYAIILAKLGKIDKAKQYLEQGIALGIAKDSVAMVQGELAHAESNYKEALDYFEEVVLQTDDEQMKKRAILLSVDVYKTIGNDVIDDEISLLEKYVSDYKEKGNWVMLEYLADAYVRKAGSDESVANEYYTKALELFQSIYDSGYMTYQLKENMAILYENMDLFDEAEAIFLQMSEEYPLRYEVYKRLAYLEADRQQMKENIDRDYQQMKAYYEKAVEMYSGKEQDMEMDMLDKMMQDLIDGGWF